MTPFPVRGCESRLEKKLTANGANYRKLVQITATARGFCLYPIGGKGAIRAKAILSAVVSAGRNYTPAHVNAGPRFRIPPSNPILPLHSKSRPHPTPNFRDCREQMDDTV